MPRPTNDPRLGCPPQRTPIVTSHSTLVRQTPTPTQTPNSSSAQEQLQLLTKSTSDADISDSRVGPGGVVGQNSPIVDYSHVVPILLKFSELSAIKGITEKEKAALQDDDASIKRRLEKAKSRDAFPVVIEGIQAEETASQSQLRNLQQFIDDNEKTRQQMAETLCSVLRQTPVSTPSQVLSQASDNDKITKLEAENQEIKAELQNLKDLILKKNDIPFDMQAHLSKLENSVRSQSISNHGANKRLRHLEEWKEIMETAQTNVLPQSAQPQTQAPDLEPLRQDVKTAQEKADETQKKAEAIESGFSALKVAMESFKEQFDKRPSSDILSALMSVEDLKRQIPELNNRLGAMEKERLDFKDTDVAAREAATAMRGLISQYETLVNNHNGRMQILECIGNNLSTRVEELKKGSDLSQPETSNHNEEVIIGLKESVEKMEKGHLSLWNNVNQLILETPKSTKQVLKCISATESLVTAVRSLENRYSNINSEHLVRHMAVAMQEMYPSMPQALERIGFLKEYCTKEIAALKEVSRNVNLASVDEKLGQFREEVSNQLHPLQSTLKEQATNITQQLHEINELKNKFQTQSDVFSELGDSIPQALQQIERVTVLSTKIGTLSEGLESLKIRLEGLNSGNASQVEDATEYQELPRTYDTLLGRCTSSDPQIKDKLIELARLKVEFLTRANQIDETVQSFLNRDARVGLEDECSTRGLPGLPGSSGDDFRILGTAARNTAERDRRQARSGSPHTVDAPLTTRVSGNGNGEIGAHLKRPRQSTTSDDEARRPPVSPDRVRNASSGPPTEPAAMRAMKRKKAKKGKNRQDMLC
ncbi:uncharacterized protein N7482_003309 [Penicillium canariense]|uniref:Uncharacterized protein n=1 Tax=Penicillium canariense TaxID=189055 RepID=A0A9W9I4B3_9EURO|nr:uncharacterized protein N7482_003309 [Penicillium canariense]KAJ5167715.1 hypothetical protein N7482_003309 [Penicillium canariense]